MAAAYVLLGIGLGLSALGMIDFIRNMYIV